MSSTVILSIIVVYFGLLFFVSWFTSRKGGDNDTFFKANKNSKWYLVAFGMIGTALSGVTFISVPGKVGNPEVQFKYFQFVLGNAIGFILIAKVLLPLYYRMNLTSIYEYIEKRLGIVSYKTASTIFLVSRTLGSAARLYLVVLVLQHYVFDDLGVPFWVTVLGSLGLIFAYTYRSGLKTIILTDTLQTVFLVASVIFTIYFVCDQLNLTLPQAFEAVKESNYSRVFFFDDAMKGTFFPKQLLGGIFVTLAMVGLDQDLMQKNLSCKTIGEAQKNMLVFTGIFVFVVLFFLCVGAMLYMYAEQNGVAVPENTDFLFPEIAFNHFKGAAAVVFLLGLTAATFATTDSALTALTTSFCVDFLQMDKKPNTGKTVRTRHFVHIAFSFCMFLAIMVFFAVNNKAVVDMIFLIAGYTYGPLLGLYAFGLLMKTKTVRDRWVPIVCLVAPVVTYFIQTAPWPNGYVFAEEIIIVNGLLTFLGLWIISQPTDRKTVF